MLGLVLFLNRVTISRRLDVQTKACQSYGSWRLRMTRLTAVHCPGPVAQVNRAWCSRRSAFFLFLFNSFFTYLHATFFFSNVFFVTKTKTNTRRKQVFFLFKLQKKKKKERKRIEIIRNCEIVFQLKRHFRRKGRRRLLRVHGKG